MPNFLIYNSNTHPIWMGDNLTDLGVWVDKRMDTTHESDEFLRVYRDDLGDMPMATGQAYLVAGWALGQRFVRLVKDLEAGDTIYFMRRDGSEYYQKVDKIVDMGENWFSLRCGLAITVKAGHELVKLHSK